MRIDVKSSIDHSELKKKNEHNRKKEARSVSNLKHKKESNVMSGSTTLHDPNQELESILSVIQKKDNPSN